MKGSNQQEVRKRKHQEAKVQREVEKRRRKARKKLLKIGSIVGASLVVLLSGYLLYGRFVGKRGGVTVSVMSAKYHLAPGELPPNYTTDPPTSGPHTPYLAKWGVHREPIPKEVQVHNLEDGGVIVHYNCPDGCPELVEKLEGIVKRFDRVILAPSPGMDKRIALTAWGKLDEFDNFDEERIVRFIKAYMGIDHH
ncbi:MAG: DUF3105 domain-containing protein [candidate division NC10 bacterium]|nr:DUF3105 domain-containing protein [candidate division NC10 bacterium]